MVQTERETGALRGQFARQVTVQASAAAQAESARAQAEQLSRKLAAARAEVRRYQTRMFAFERTLLALKHDNAELEAACEQAREQLEQANARAEQAEAACRRAEAALAAMQQTAPETPAQPDTIPEAVPQCEAVEEQPAPETEELLCAPEQALPPEPAQSAWHAGDPAGADGCGADGLVRCHDAPRVNLERTVACFAQQSFFFLRGTI